MLAACVPLTKLLCRNESFLRSVPARDTVPWPESTFVVSVEPDRRNVKSSGPPCIPSMWSLVIALIEFDRGSAADEEGEYSASPPSDGLEVSGTRKICRVRT